MACRTCETIVANTYFCLKSTKTCSSCTSRGVKIPKSLYTVYKGRSTIQGYRVICFTPPILLEFQMIGVVDYKTCNVGSILNMLKCIGAKARKISCAQDIDGIERLILPGVGAFDHAIRNIDSLGYRDRLISYALVEQRPILGICVGMQVMSDSSEEGSERGLGLFQAETKSIRARVDSNIKVPNMGWSSVSIKRAHPIFNGLENDARFYFVHSYFVDCHENNDVLATKSYGIEFPVAICKKNILAVQFHPEKSHEFGKRLFRNFLEIEV